MARCYICDWTPGNEQSDFFLCLPESEKTVAKNFLLTDETGHTICHQCDCESQMEIEDELE
jgi:hypothetical protein